MNLQIARAYLAASDPQIATRNWQFVMEEMVKLKKGETSTAPGIPPSKDKAFDLIRHLPVLETGRKTFCALTEKFRRNADLWLIHNFALT